MAGANNYDKYHNRDWYKKSRKKFIEKNREKLNSYTKSHHKKNYNQNKEWLEEYTHGCKCQRCGYNEFFVLLMDIIKTRQVKMVNVIHWGCG